jgi:uncharacterized peroxidase-related enzyme
MTLSPKVQKALGQASVALEESTLGKKLINLVFQRVSQINGCAYCVDMHARDLLAMGEDLQRLNSLVAWRESPFFSERERAAFQWADGITNISETHAPEADFEPLRQHFDEKEIVELTYAIAVMNAWNRVAISLHEPVKKAALLPREAPVNAAET